MKNNVPLMELNIHLISNDAILLHFDLTVRRVFSANDVLGMGDAHWVN